MQQTSELLSAVQYTQQLSWEVVGPATYLGHTSDLGWAEGSGEIQYPKTMLFADSEKGLETLKDSAVGTKVFGQLQVCFIVNIKL